MAEEKVEKLEKTPPKETSATSTKPANNTTRNVLLIVAGVLVIALAFGAGMAASERHERMRVSGFGPMMMGERGERGFRTGGGPFGGQGTVNDNGIALSGKVTSVSGSSLTIDQNGSSKTVKTDGNTHFGGVGMSGIKSGDQVSVVGTTNSDGSIQASRVIVTSSSSTSST